MFVSVARGDVRLYLSEHRGDATPNTLVHLYVRNVDDIAAEFGVAIDEEGLAGRECELADPDGEDDESKKTTFRRIAEVGDILGRRWLTTPSGAT